MTRRTRDPALPVGGEGWVLTYASVCDGIGAAHVAWRPLGMRPLWLSEIAPFPSAVTAHHYPETPNHGDLTTLWTRELAAPDVLIGGTPCQSFSVAGLRGGLADPRGNLALAFVALVAHLRPRWVLWENVPGVLSVDGGRAFGSILGGLAELGYGWAYRILDAQYHHLAQRRERVFVVACPGDWRRAAAVLFEPEGVRRHSPPSREAGAGVAGAVGTGASGGGGWRCGADEAAAGHAVAVDLQNTALGSDVAGTVDCSRPGRGGGQAVMEVARSLNAHASRSDWETETLIPFDTTQITSKANRSNPKAGDACHPLAAHAHVPAIAHTLRAEGFDASEDGTGRGPPLVSEPQTFAWQLTGTDRSNIHDTPGRARALGTQGLAVRMSSRVRRLMPVELERLQGFPDGWTDIPWRGKPGAPDGPRAKGLGNSMAVPVIAWIGRRILAVDALVRTSA